ncbi:MAG: DNA polymerase III subunit [Elusimicrobiota bacterium]|jgi:DNA polymerase-3 subunit delta'|nr:DNA polymerase III subunit [Elusimicrobiota bacterium]
MSFKKILGQDKAINTLRGFIAAGRIPQAMIFHGPAGVGKAMAALEFAKTLNCLDAASNKIFDNCGLCQNCKHIDAKTHPDIIFADFAYQAMLRKEEVEKQQNIRIETIRALTAASQQKAVFAKWKVYIIDSAEKLITGAANALLKYIEEPPPNTIWILISSKKEAMLSTIKSRCQPVAFAPLSKDIITTILKDNFVEADLAEQAAAISQGSSAKAALAAEVLGDFASLPSGAAFAAGAAMSLPRVAAQARAQVASVLDMLSVMAYEQWVKEASEREANKNLLTKLVFYKRALLSNVSPYLIMEAALMAADDCKINFK